MRAPGLWYGRQQEHIGHLYRLVPNVRLHVPCHGDQCNLLQNAPVGAVLCAQRPGCGTLDDSGVRQRQGGEKDRRHHYPHRLEPGHHRRWSGRPQPTRYADLCRRARCGPAGGQVSRKECRRQKSWRQYRASGRRGAERTQDRPGFRWAALCQHGRNGRPSYRCRRPQRPAIRHRARKCRTPAAGQSHAVRGRPGGYGAVWRPVHGRQAAGRGNSTGRRDFRFCERRGQQDTKHSGPRAVLAVFRNRERGETVFF